MVDDFRPATCRASSASIRYVVPRSGASIPSHRCPRIAVDGRRLGLRQAAWLIVRRVVTTASIVPWGLPIGSSSSNASATASSNGSATRSAQAVARAASPSTARICRCGRSAWPRTSPNAQGRSEVGPRCGRWPHGTGRRRRPQRDRPHRLGHDYPPVPMDRRRPPRRRPPAAHDRDLAAVGALQTAWPEAGAPALGRAPAGPPAARLPQRCPGRSAALPARADPARTRRPRDR